MKCKIQNLVILLIVFLTFSSVYSQIDVEIENMTYNTGEAINPCSIIDLEDNTSVIVNFVVNLQKDANNVVGNSTLKIHK